MESAFYAPRTEFGTGLIKAFMTLREATLPRLKPEEDKLEEGRLFDEFIGRYITEQEEKGRFVSRGQAIKSCGNHYKYSRSTIYARLNLWNKIQRNKTDGCRELNSEKK